MVLSRMTLLRNRQITQLKEHPIALFPFPENTKWKEIQTVKGQEGKQRVPRWAPHNTQEPISYTLKQYAEPGEKPQPCSRPSTPRQ